MKNKKIRRVLTALCALVFIVCIGVVGFQLYQYYLGNVIYSEAQQMLELPQFDPAEPPQTSGQPEQPPEGLSQPSQSEPVQSEPPQQQVPPDQSGIEAPPSAQPPAEVPPQESGDTQPTEAPVPPEVVLPEDPYAAALNKMDFSVLQQVNSDVVGWITIPNTKLSYPLLQGKDNQTYLNRTWKKTWGAVGSIFLECQSNRDLSSFNTIVYGHRMRDGSMFGSLRNYSRQSYWKEHPSVYITDSNGTHIYDIYAAYEAELDGPTYWVDIQTAEHKQRFIDYTVEKSVLDTGLVPGQDDQILTMSTCTGNGYATRWVVHALKRSTVSETEKIPTD